LLASTSCNERAERLLQQVLHGQAPDIGLARSLARDDCSDALFRVVVEGLADRFQPALCDAYVEIFSEVIAQVSADFEARQLQERYRRVRNPRPCTAQPECVFILSRVTLGADIAVTSVFLNAAKQRFPEARICLVGSSKAAELWAADQRIQHVPAPYPRTGSLQDRLLASIALKQLLSRPGSIVLDPDSRLSQLGLVPVCEETDYFFFESRGYGGETTRALPELAAEWCGEVLGVRNAFPYLALADTTRAETTGKQNASQVAISLGVGQNQAKRLGADFESGLLGALANNFGALVIDSGAGHEESDRVRAAIAGSGVTAEVLSGSFANFAARIASSELYVGYDSAGQHAAAALSIPLVTVFRGHVSDRMFERWKPTGKGPIAVVNAEKLSTAEALDGAMAAVQAFKIP
jgi:ADP-heptose:LPS heptosyltransferase